MSIKTKIDNAIRYARKGLPKKKSKQLSVFIRDYYREVQTIEIVNRSTRSLAYTALSHFQLADSWTRGHRKIRIYNPETGADGWESKHTIIQIVFSCLDQH